MQRFYDYKICRESAESQRAAGRYNPASVLLWESTYKRVKSRHRLILDAGESDYITVYRDKREGLVFILSVNYRYDYCGLQVYSEPAGGPVGGVFCQGSEQIADCVGPRGLDLSDRTIAKRLAVYAAELCC